MGVFFGHIFRLKIVSLLVSSSSSHRHVSRVRRVRAAVPHRQGTYSRRSRILTLPPSSSVRAGPFLSLFFRALKVSLSIALSAETRTRHVVHLSLALYKQEQSSKQRLRGIEAQKANITAAKSVARTLRSSLGPKVSSSSNRSKIVVAF